MVRSTALLFGVRKTKHKTTQATQYLRFIGLVLKLPRPDSRVVARDQSGCLRAAALPLILSVAAAITLLGQAVGTKPVFQTGMRILCGASLKFCQFPSQSAKFQKTAFYFTEIPAHQFFASPATGAFIDIPEHVPNYLFRRTKKLCYLTILPATRDQEHGLELHWVQEIC